MKTNGQGGRKSTSLATSTTQISSQRQENNDYKSRRSVSRLNLDKSERNSNDVLFDTLMSDPVNRVVLLKMLSQEKGNIEKYKRDEQKKHAVQEKRLKNTQRLLHCESPTALLRRRVLEKNRRDSDSSSTTSNSRSLTASPVAFDQILKGVVAYVEIRGREGDRSAGAKALMQAMGAIIKSSFSSDVTHVVFKDGSFNTYQRAKLMKVHLVSVLWLEAARKNNTRVPEKGFPALGMESYDANISQICQDYEQVVNEEYRRSLAIAAPDATADKNIKYRKTALPSELQSLRKNLDLPSYPNGRLSEVVIPTSQDWEGESVISYDSGILPFRKVVPTINEEGSDKLGNEIPELSSDNDSECGVINGDSVKRESIPVDLLGKWIDAVNMPRLENLIPEPPNINGNYNKHSTSTVNTSSTRSVSLLSRNSIPNRKSSYELVDMDITETVVNETGHCEKENVNSKSRTSENFLKKNKRDSRALLSVNSSNLLPEVGGTPNADLKLQKSQSSGAQNERNSSRTTLLSGDSRNLSNEISETFVRVVRRSTRISVGVVSDEKLANLSKDCKRISSSEDVTTRRITRSSSELTEIKQTQKDSLDSMSPLRISSNSINNTRESNKSTEKINSKSSKGKHSLTSEDTSSVVMISNNSNTATEKRDSIRRSTRLSPGSAKLAISETMSPLRMSSENSNELQKRVTRSSSHREDEVIGKDSKKCSLVSEDLSSLRISTDSTSNVNKANESAQGTYVIVEKNHNRFSSATEDMSSLRISTESRNSNLDLQHTNKMHVPKRTSNENSWNRNSGNSEDSQTSSNRARRSSSCALRQLKVNVVRMSDLELSGIDDNNKNSSFKSAEYTPRSESVVSNIISSLEAESAGKRKNNNECNLSNKKQKLQNSEQQDENKNKKYRKLYNLNQSVEETLKNWDWENVQPDNVPAVSTIAITGKKSTVKKKTTTGRKTAVGKKTTVVSLTPISVTPTAKKLFESLTENSGKVKKKKPDKVPKKVKNPPKPVKKVYVDEGRDEQKELTKEYVDKNKTPETSKEGKKHPEQKSQSGEPSNSDEPVVPELNRRSTLEFMQMSQTRSQRKPQKNRKTKSSIVCTRLHKPEVIKFMEIVKKLGNFFTEDEVSKKTTHVVVGEPKRTINLLRAIARGCWIVSQEWLFRSLEVGKWLPEEDFEVTEFSPAVQQCRIQREAFGPFYAMDIFENCGPIFISRRTTPSCANLQELVKLCKGTITDVPYNATTVVGERMRYSSIKCVSEAWILDSITFNKRKSLKKYLIQKTN